MAAPVLYSIDFSPPCRSVRLTAGAIGLELNVKTVNLLAGEHKTEAFLKINPQHSVPTLDDNGAVFWDSHAICTYLISKYGSNDALYPRDFVERAKVDQRLHFDTGVLYPASRAANVAIFGGAAEVPQPLLDNITAAYDTTEQLLQGNDYLVGNNLTVADLCCVASVSSLNIHVQVDAVKYPNISAWLNRLSKLPYYNELNDKPVKAFQAFIAQKKTANK